MDSYEKQLLVARIKCGYYIYKHKNITLKITPPTKEQEYESLIVYKQAYEEALKDGNMVKSEVLEMLESQSLWDDEHGELLEELSQEEENLKKELFNNFFKDSEKKDIKFNLSKVKKGQAKLRSIRHSYDFLTCEGIATYAKAVWIVENTTTYLDGEQYKFLEMPVTEVLKKFNQDSITDEEFRELARTSPWRNTWNCNNSCAYVFSESVSDLTPNQMALISYSVMYDNIYQSQECPPDEVIEDNDAIDGWLIIQREKRGKKQRESLLENLHKRHENAKDIFVMAENREDADRISELNGDIGKHIRASRLGKLNKEGTVAHHAFSDIQADLKGQLMEAGAEF
jgi:hypothetical protein